MMCGSGNNITYVLSECESRFLVSGNGILEPCVCSQRSHSHINFLYLLSALVQVSMLLGKWEWGTEKTR